MKYVSDFEASNTFFSYINGICIGRNETSDNVDVFLRNEINYLVDHELDGPTRFSGENMKIFVRFMQANLTAGIASFF